MQRDQYIFQDQPNAQSAISDPLKPVYRFETPLRLGM
jgi:hypothetical protein